MFECRQLSEAFPDLIIPHSGDQKRKFYKITSAVLADRQSLIFVNNTADLALSIQNQAAAIVFNKTKNPQSDTPSDITFLSSPNPYLAMARCLSTFFPNQRVPQNEARIHPTAQVSTQASIGPNVFIGANTIIHGYASIKENCVIRENCVIETSAEIGANSHLHPFVVIGRNCKLGRDCIIQSFTTIGSEGFGYAIDEKNERHHIPHKGSVILGDRVEIGASCTIDRGTFEDTVIGEACKLDNQIHIGHNVRIGNRATLTGGYMMAGSTIIGDNFTAGARSGTLGHLRVGDNVTLTTDAIVVTDILEPGVYGGFPAIPVAQFKKNLVTLRKIGELRTQVTQLMKAVFKEKH